ncbi:MAG: TerB family tellurite resistance protein [Alphaproteobacteria bacterium]|nr:MAG: TerB family tellurite resistance protein [Alphaproteobacteria bacterium]
MIENPCLLLQNEGMNISSDQKQYFPTSMFYMWRSLLLLAWADGECGHEETAYFAQVFDNLPRYYSLTQEHKDTLAAELVAPQNQAVHDFFAYINDPDTRRNLYLFAHDLAMLDGILHPAEKDILDRLQLGAPAALTMEEVCGIIVEVEEESERERQQIRQEIQALGPFYAALDRLLLRLGIDLIK